ncbi:lactate racemase domain-containing protein, partial [Candidatus Omnitrophota bacterium]
CRENLIELGTTSNGIPVAVNRDVFEADIKIGISCIVPHPAAGFSGGGKIVAPGVCGFETIRKLHDDCKGATKRAGSINTQFRAVIDEISNMIGLDFSINVIINDKKKIVQLFCGDKEESFCKAVDYVREHFSLDIDHDVDVAIIDAYPCDRKLNVAMDRGFWPLYVHGNKTEKVILAQCKEGVGGHELYSAKKPFLQRIIRRLRNFNCKEIFCLHERLWNMLKMVKKFNVRFSFISTFLPENSIKNTFKNVIFYSSWDKYVNSVSRQFANKKVRAVIYKASPLFFEQ